MRELVCRTSLSLAEGLEVPVYCLNTVIVGAGAAGMNCAVHLYEFLTARGIGEAQDRVAVVTAGLGLGASRMSGSDKQTYYKLGTSPIAADSAMEFARTLSAFGCAHGDVALAEGESSLREFYHLVEAGVPFPHDPEGAYIGYKTDHDPLERATSAGPRTSRYMAECMQRQAQRLGLTVFDSQEVAHILKGDDGRLRGVVCLDRRRLEEPSFGLTVFLCENLVLAAGGPGALYEVSVYPPGQTGIHGLALAAGLQMHNVTESQFGLASTAFRWNVSGTYMQVVPRIFSTDSAGGDEREFLAPFFDTTARMATCIFLKGYQWPFDPQRILGQQSSLIDVLVYYETRVLGRRVFMDFTSNPVPGQGKEPFDLMAMEAEALTYLQRNGALQPTPIQRLEHMNPLAIDIYAEHDIDIRTQPLEINVCAQHHNGGFVVDKWWQSNIANTFVIGEMAGTHGVKRPGGSALNAGQVGGLRAAEYIAHTCELGAAKMADGDVHQVQALRDKLYNLLQSNSPEIRPAEAIASIQSSMSVFGGHIRGKDAAARAKVAAIKLDRLIHQGGLRLEGPMDLPLAVQAEHLALTQVAFLQAICDYIDAEGGSRGSYVVLGDEGDVIHGDLLNPDTCRPYAFLPENEELRRTITVIELESADGPIFRTSSVPVRPIPQRDEPFELAWAAFRSGEVYRK